MPLKVIRRHGSPFWYLRGTVRGISVDESTKTRERKIAEKVRVKREGELTTQSIDGRRAVVSFASAAVSYLEAGGESRFLTPILTHFGQARLASITQERIDEAAAKIYPSGKPATLNRQVYAPIAAVLNHAASKDWCAKPVIARCKEPKGRIRWLTRDEAHSLVTQAGDHLKPLLTFFLLTGARVSEAIYLDWRNVDLSRGQVVFPDTKNGEARGVPLHPSVIAALANLEGREGNVFRRPDGEPYAMREGYGGQIRTAFAGACRRAGIKDFHPHDCRHTWATWHYAENRDLLALMRLGGWKSLAMVERYAHVNTANFAPSIARISWADYGDVTPMIEKGAA